MNFSNGRQKGLLLVLATAFISGASIFSNKYALASFDPFIFTTLKNALVAVFVFAGFLLASRINELKNLRKKDWMNLFFIGLIGGGIPFLLFFWGLKVTPAPNASLIHKSLFLFATAFAIVFLKEKISFKQFGATMILFAGAFLLSGLMIGPIGIGELAILAAVLLWSFENVLSKKMLNANISANTVIVGRMFFGSLVMLVFLFIAGYTPNPLNLSLNHWAWLLISTIFLFAYQLTYYHGLKFLGVSEATSILVFGTVVTSLLSFVATGVILLPEAFGDLLVLLGTAVLVLFPSEVNSRVPMPAEQSVESQ